MPFERPSPPQKRRNQVILGVAILLVAAGAAVLYSPLAKSAAAAEPGPRESHGLGQASLRASAGKAGVKVVKASSIEATSLESADAVAAELAAAEETAAEELAAAEEAAAADLAAVEAAVAAEVAAAEALAAAGAVAEEEVAAAEAAAPRPGPSPASLAACDSFACLRENQVPGAKYPFPHFVIIGFAKSATTSIADYLRYHPEVSYPTKKVRSGAGRGGGGGALSVPGARVSHVIQAAVTRLTACTQCFHEYVRRSCTTLTRCATPRRPATPPRRGTTSET